MFDHVESLLIYNIKLDVFFDIHQEKTINYLLPEGEGLAALEKDEIHKQFITRENPEMCS